MKYGENNRFLALDVDLRSTHSLDPLVEALGPKIVQVEKRFDRDIYYVSFELSDAGKSVDESISQFATLLRLAPKAARRAWFQAYERVFNIGVNVGEIDHCFETRIGSSSVQHVHELKSKLVFSAYPSE